MKQIFNETQLLAIELLAEGGKTYKEIASKCGVSAETLRKWRKDQDFQEEVRLRCRQVLREYEPALYKLAFDAANESKSYHHIKLLLDRIERLEDIAEGRGREYDVMFTWRKEQ